MKYIILNQNYLNDIITSDDDYEQAIENHRLISKIDNNGNINGSILLFNHKQSRYGIRKVTRDISKIREYHPNGEADAMLDSFVFVTEDNKDSYSGYSFDGILREGIKKEMLGEQINSTGHIYDIIDLDGDNIDLDCTNSI
jgi:hypothetical protein